MGAMAKWVLEQELRESDGKSKQNVGKSLDKRSEWSQTISTIETASWSTQYWTDKTIRVCPTGHIWMCNGLHVQ